MSINRKRLKQIEDVKDVNIDYSDIPELGDDFWAGAKASRV